MNVILLNESFPPLIDGVSNVVLNYADRLSRLGHSSAVVTTRVLNAKDDYAFPVLRYQAFYLGRNLEYPVGNPYAPGIVKRILKEKPQVLHVHSPFISSVVARRVRKKTGCPVVTTYHTKFDIEFNTRTKFEPFRKFARWLLIRNMNDSDEVWVVSTGAGENLRGLGYEGEYVVMPNGTDFPLGRAPESAVEEIGREHGVAPEELVFLYVGRLRWYKNIRLILDALRTVKDRGVKFRFLLVGKGKDSGEIKSYIKKLGLESEVKVCGPCSDRDKLKAYYSRADLFLFPSTFDTFGLVVKEAAACGCPSVLVKDSCAADGVVDGRNGYLTEENASSLAETILRAAKDRRALKRVGEAAAEELYYSWDEAIRDAVARYENLINN